MSRSLSILATALLALNFAAAPAWAQTPPANPYLVNVPTITMPNVPPIWA